MSALGRKQTLLSWRRKRQKRSGI